MIRQGDDLRRCRPATIHRTYLTFRTDTRPGQFPVRANSGTAPCACGAAPSDWRNRPAFTLGIAEGIETALAAQILFKVPTWAAICANGISSFEPPNTTERLLVFADNDINQVGQRAAAALADRISCRMLVETIIPDTAGLDWNDVLLRRSQ